jgi:hypothetical protein
LIAPTASAESQWRRGAEKTFNRFNEIKFLVGWIFSAERQKYPRNHTNNEIHFWLSLRSRRLAPWRFRFPMRNGKSWKMKNEKGKVFGEDTLKSRID